MAKREALVAGEERRLQVSEQSMVLAGDTAGLCAACVVPSRPAATGRGVGPPPNRARVTLPVLCMLCFLWTQELEARLSVKERALSERSEAFAQVCTRLVACRHAAAFLLDRQ